VADLTVPRKIHDELISDGRAKPHPAGFANVVSYHLREPEDVPKVVELFRISYERAKESAERRKAERSIPALPKDGLPRPQRRSQRTRGASEASGR
jgi:hypothetical protein